MSTEDTELQRVKDAVIEAYKDDCGCTRDSEVEVKRTPTGLDIHVSQMYEYVPVNYEYLKKISAITGSDKIDVDNYSSGGCETCDYGSSYEVTFHIVM